MRERKVSSLQDKMAAQIKAEIDNSETTEEDREILKQKLRQMKMKKIEDLGKRIDNIHFED